MFLGECTESERSEGGGRENDGEDDGLGRMDGERFERVGGSAEGGRGGGDGGGGRGLSLLLAEDVSRRFIHVGGIEGVMAVAWRRHGREELCCVFGLSKSCSSWHVNYVEVELDLGWKWDGPRLTRILDKWMLKCIIVVYSYFVS